MRAVSILEGGFDSVNTYDTGYVSVGFIQFASLKEGGGSLGAVLKNFKAADPLAFASDFHRFGVDVDETGHLVVVDPTSGAVATGAEANARIIEDKRLIAVFGRAGARAKVSAPPRSAPRRRSTGPRGRGHRPPERRSDPRARGRHRLQRGGPRHPLRPQGQHRQRRRPRRRRLPRRRRPGLHHASPTSRSTRRPSSASSATARTTSATPPSPNPPTRPPRFAFASSPPVAVEQRGATRVARSPPAPARPQPGARRGHRVNLKKKLGRLALTGKPPPHRLPSPTL